MPGMRKTMGEFKRGTLKSGSGKKVTSRKQAVAIAMSQEKKMAAKKPKSKPVPLGGVKKPRKAAPKPGGVPAKNTGGYTARRKAGSVGTPKSPGWAKGKKTM